MLPWIYKGIQCDFIDIKTTIELEGYKGILQEYRNENDYLKFQDIMDSYGTGEKYRIFMGQESVTISIVS